MSEAAAGLFWRGVAVHPHRRKGRRTKDSGLADRQAGLRTPIARSATGSRVLSPESSGISGGLCREGVEMLFQALSTLEHVGGLAVEDDPAIVDEQHPAGDRLDFLED